MIANLKPKTVVSRYCKSVLEGSDRAIGRFERLAVQRYLDDRKNAHKRGWYFDEQIATESCEFFPRFLRHFKAEYVDEPFMLSPWQMFTVYQLQGWRNAEEKTRRFRKLYLCIGRKNGKTAFAAGLICLLSFFDYPIEAGGRVYCAATKKPQARLLWDDVKQFIQASPALADLVEVRGENREGGGTITVRPEPWHDYRILTVGADATRQDGLNPSIVVKDEMHEWQLCHKPLDEKLSTGSLARRQALEIITTTAGTDESLIWIAEHEANERILSASEVGQHLDDTVLSLIYQVDPEDDVTDIKALGKANPNMGISVKEKNLRAQVTEAKVKPAALAALSRYHANRRTAAFSRAWSDQLWNMGRRPFTPPDNALCFGGVDLGRTSDFCAVALCFPMRTDEEITRKSALHHGWEFGFKVKMWGCRGTPGSETAVPWDQEPFASWVRNGDIEFEEDEVIDYAGLKQYLVDAKDRYRLRTTVYDKTFAQEVMSSLMNDHGLNVEIFEQSYRNYTGPILSFEKALREGRILHGCDPLLTWCAQNATLKRNTFDQVILNKGGAPWLKIDGVVGLMMSYAVAIVAKKTIRSGGALVTA